MPRRLSLLATAAVSSPAALILLVGLASAVTDPAHALTLRGSASAYALNHNPDGSVVRWNPCSTIHYRVNLTAAPPGALADVKSAVTRLERASGLHLHYDGVTSVIPQVGYGRTARPTAPPPLVLAWAAAGRGPGRSNLLGRDLGYGGWVTRWWTDGSGRHRPRIVTGYVVINTAARLPAGFRGQPSGSRGELIMHELGHAVGLGHARDRQQIMYPTLGPWPGVWGAGDTAALSLVGRSPGCLG